MINKLGFLAKTLAAPNSAAYFQLFTSVEPSHLANPSSSTLPCGSFFKSTAIIVSSSL